MEVKKVNELEENNKITKLIGLDSEGDMFSAVAENIVGRAIYQKSSGKENVGVWISVGMAQIFTTKGIAAYLHLDYYKDGILLGDTQYYTTNYNDAVNNKKIYIHYDYDYDKIVVDDYTGENLDITLCALGLTYEAYYSMQ